MLIVLAKLAMVGLPLAPDIVLIEAVRQVLNWALTLVIWITLIYVLISWVNPMAPVAPALSMLLQPLLGPIRRILPTIGGIDLSPMVLLIAVYVAADGAGTHRALKPRASPRSVAECLPESLARSKHGRPCSSARRWPRS